MSNLYAFADAPGILGTVWNWFTGGAWLVVASALSFVLVGRIAMRPKTVRQMTKDAAWDKGQAGGGVGLDKKDGANGGKVTALNIRAIKEIGEFGMKILASIVFGGVGFYIVLSQHYDGKLENFAYCTLGTVLGTWAGGGRK